MNGRKLTLLFGLYALSSLFIFATVAFTEAAALAYLFILLPFYLACILYCLKLSLEHHYQTIRFERSWVLWSLIGQGLVVLSSPADCYGWHQGRACYSFLQVHLGSIDVQGETPHWSLVELMFPIAGLLYILFVIAALKSIRFEDP